MVNHVRMQRAGQLPEVGALSIYESTKFVGYASRSHLARRARMVFRSYSMARLPLTGKGRGTSPDRSRFF